MTNAGQLNVFISSCIGTSNPCSSNLKKTFAYILLGTY